MITRKVAPGARRRLHRRAASRPSETPLSALALAELAERAGMPKGVFNVVTGERPRRSAAELTANPLVRKITFTGSTEVGKILMRAGGAHREAASRWSSAATRRSSCSTTPTSTRRSQGAIASKFRNAGQTCVCANRILVQAGVYDAFAAKLAEAVRKLKVGPRHRGGRDAWAR